jgi:DNA recombination protein Rad52
MFTDQQVVALSSDLDRRHVKTRQQAGRTLSYIEGWQAIAEANSIFGFDGWSSETIELRCVAERERKIGQSNPRDGWGVSYIAKVRVTVYAGDTLMVREGVGSGHGIDVDLGLAHESAVKEAETDARKRALMTFGNPFGLALYDKEQAHVTDGTSKQQAKTATVETTSKISTLQRLLYGIKTATENGSLAELEAWYKTNAADIAGLEVKDKGTLRKAYQLAMDVLKSGKEAA